MPQLTAVIGDQGGRENKARLVAASLSPGTTLDSSLGWMFGPVWVEAVTEASWSAGVCRIFICRISVRTEPQPHREDKFQNRGLWCTMVLYM